MNIIQNDSVIFVQNDGVIFLYFKAAQVLLLDYREYPDSHIEASSWFSEDFTFLLARHSGQFHYGVRMKRLKIIGVSHKRTRKLIICALLVLFIACSVSFAVIYADYMAAQGSEKAHADTDDISIPSEEVQEGEVTTEQTPEVPWDVREVRFDNIEISSFINDGDYIDIRLRFPNGDDCVVASKKQLMEVDRFGSSAVICVSEEELLTINSARAKGSIVDGAKLYAVKYVDPDTQPAAEISFNRGEKTDMLEDEYLTKQGGEDGR